MVLGLYYLSLKRKGLIGEGKTFASIEEVEHARTRYRGPTFKNNC